MKQGNLFWTVIFVFINTTIKLQLVEPVFVVTYVFSFWESSLTHLHINVSFISLEQIQFFWFKKIERILQLI